MSSKRILVLGDSLTFGRPRYHIYYENTWPGLLDADGFHVFHRGRGGADILSVLGEIKHLCGYMASQDNDGYMPFDFCVVQVGIVDATPRLFSRESLRLIKYLPGSGRFVSKLTRSGKLVQRFGKPWVCKDDFRCSAYKVLEKSAAISKRVLFLEIAKPEHNLIKNCGDFSKVISEYNDVLKSLSENSFVPIFSGKRPGDLVLPDGHHLSLDGHKVVASSINAYLCGSI